MKLHRDIAACLIAYLLSVGWEMVFSERRIGIILEAGIRTLPMACLLAAGVCEITGPANRRIGDDDRDGQKSVQQRVQGAGGGAGEVGQASS